MVDIQELRRRCHWSSWWDVTPYSMKKCDLVDDVELTTSRLYVWYMAAVRQIGFLKETCLDHSTPWGRSLSTYSSNFVKTSWSGTEICPQDEILNRPLVAEFYFRFQFWQVSSFGDLPVYDTTKFQENRSTRSSVICNSTFSISTFKPTLPMAQRHSTVMQAIYWSPI